jgi:hypothetical protein
MTSLSLFDISGWEKGSYGPSTFFLWNLICLQGEKHKRLILARCGGTCYLCKSTTWEVWIDQSGLQGETLSKPYMTEVRFWWLTPVIQATWEAKIRKIVVQVQHGLLVPKIPTQWIVGCIGAHLSYQAAQEAKIRRLMVPGQPCKKVCKAPI